VRPNSVLESVLAVPIPGSIVPEKGTESNPKVRFGEIVAIERFSILRLISPEYLGTTEPFKVSIVFITWYCRTFERVLAVATGGQLENRAHVAAG